MSPLDRVDPRPYGLVASGQVARGLPLLALALCLALVVWKAWMCDDAFISLRTVDHFVHGRGLRWNLDERVQAYTHPLWVLVLSVPYALTREPYLTTLAVSIVLTALYLVSLWRLHGDSNGSLLTALLVLCASKPFLEFSTSGLENCLVHLLISLTWWRAWGPPTRRVFLHTCLLAGLAALTRIDTALLVAPAVLLHAHRARAETSPGRLLRTALAGATPLVAWTLFSLVYYGRPVPNTAYAKVNTGLGLDYLAPQGLRYLASCALADPLGCLALAWLILRGARRRTWEALMPCVAALAWLLYQLRIGGDFMVGRYLTPPVALAAVCVAREASGFAAGRLAPTAAALVMLLWPASPARLVHLRRAGPMIYHRGVSDEWAAYRSTLALFHSEDPDPAQHPAAREAREYGRSTDAQQPVVRIAIGIFGYYAPPEAIIVDALALADPLLACFEVVGRGRWRPGHYTRPIPAGYLRARLDGTSDLADPDLARFYAELRHVVAAPIWSAGRARAIWDLNSGAHRNLLRNFTDSLRAGDPSVEDEASPNRQRLERAAALPSAAR